MFVPREVKQSKMQAVQGVASTSIGETYVTERRAATTLKCATDSLFLFPAFRRRSVFLKPIGVFKQSVAIGTLHDSRFAIRTRNNDVAV